MTGELTTLHKLKSDLNTGNCLEGGMYCVGQQKTSIHDQCNGCKIEQFPLSVYGSGHNSLDRNSKVGSMTCANVMADLTISGYQKSFNISKVDQDTGIGCSTVLQHCYDNYIYHIESSNSIAILSTQNSQPSCQCDVNKNPAASIVSPQFVSGSKSNLFDSGYATVTDSFCQSCLGNSDRTAVENLEQDLCHVLTISKSPDMLYADVSSAKTNNCTDVVSEFGDCLPMPDIVENLHGAPAQACEDYPLVPEKNYLLQNGSSNSHGCCTTSNCEDCIGRIPFNQEENQNPDHSAQSSLVDYPAFPLPPTDLDFVHMTAPQFDESTLQATYHGVTYDGSDYAQEFNLTAHNDSKFEGVAMNEMYGMRHEGNNSIEVVESCPLLSEPCNFTANTLASSVIEPTHMSWDEVMHEAKVLGIPWNKPLGSREQLLLNAAPPSPRRSAVDGNRKKKGHLMDKLKLAIFSNSKLGHASADDVNYSCHKHVGHGHGGMSAFPNKSSTGTRVRTLGDQSTAAAGSLGNCNSSGMMTVSQQWTNTNSLHVCTSPAVNRAQSCSIPRSFGLRRTPSITSGRSSTSSVTGYNYNTMVAPPSSSYPPPPMTLRSFSTPTSSHDHQQHSGCACGSSNCVGEDVMSSSTSSYRRSQSTDWPTSAAACATTPHTSMLSVRPPDSRCSSLGRWSVASSSAANSHDELSRCNSAMADSADDVFSASAPSSTLNALSSLAKLKDMGWYWGPLSWEEAEAKLEGLQDGTFLLRDSSDDRYLLSLSFRSQGSTHHTRIEHNRGMFSFYSQPKSHGATTIVEFIEEAMEHSRTGRFLYFLRPHAPGHPPAPIQLLHPISRLRSVFTLQHMCRFLILNCVRKDLLPQLPVPRKILAYLQQSQYYAEYVDEV